jgi:hypothetical protein
MVYLWLNVASLRQSRTGQKMAVKSGLSDDGARVLAAAEGLF